MTLDEAKAAFKRALATGDIEALHEAERAILEISGRETVASVMQIVGMAHG